MHTGRSRAADVCISKAARQARHVRVARMLGARSVPRIRLQLKAVM